MDKRPVYVGAIPLDLDWLQPQRNIEIALGFLMQAAFGTTTLIDGLAVVPTQPNSMKVIVGPVSIITASTVDTVASGFGSLPVDNNDALVKMGINLLPTTMAALTPPSTAGQSQNWLIEAQFLEQDTGPTVLPFYNSSNPANPYTGPANAGISNTTARTQTVQLQWKPGTPAASGQQLTPSPDAGWVGVAVVTVNNGDTSIGGLRISRAPNSPIVGTKLSNTRVKLFGNLSLYVSSTGSDANSGLSTNVAFATIQAALNSITNNYDLNGFGVTINVGAGTSFASATASGLPTGFGANSFVSIVGSGSGTIVSSGSGTGCINSGGGAVIAVSNLTVQGGIGLQAFSGGTITINGGVVFGACSGPHVNCSGTVLISGSYSISGGATQHFLTQGFGSIAIAGSNATVTISASVSFSAAFAEASTAIIQASNGSVSLSFVNASNVTGTRYISQLAGVISTNGGGANFFPGSAAGTSSTGYYI